MARLMTTEGRVQGTWDDDGMPGRGWMRDLVRPTLDDRACRYDYVCP